MAARKKAWITSWTGLPSSGRSRASRTGIFVRTTRKASVRPGTNPVPWRLRKTMWLIFIPGTWTGCARASPNPGNMKRTTIDPVKKKKLVLIGNGPAGFKFCEKFVKYRLDKHYDLVVYGEEIHPAYDRIHLTDFFAGGSAEKLYLARPAWYAQHKITLKTGQ